MNILQPLKHRTINKFSYQLVLGFSYLIVFLSISCDNDKTKTEVTTPLQKVSFSANDPSDEGITLSAYSKVKLLITTDQQGKTPVHYYVGTTEKTFDAGGTEIPIKEGALSIYLESAAGEGKAYYVHQFDLDAQSKTSYRLARVVSFKLKSTGDSKSVALALVENKVIIQGEKTAETEPTSKPKKKQKTSKGKSKSKSKSKGETKGEQASSSKGSAADNRFFFYVQFQKPGSGETTEYYKFTDKDISGISFKVIDENKTPYYETDDFFKDISKGGAEEKFKIIFPAEASTYESKILTIPDASASIGAKDKKSDQHFEAHYYDGSGDDATSIKNGGKVIFIPTRAENYVKIKDDNFRAYLKEEIPDAFKGDLMDANSPLVKNLTEIKLGYKSIISLDGIKYFTGLKTLSSAYNLLTTLDLSQNTKLESLYLCGTRLKILDLSQNTNLTYLHISNDRSLKGLSLSQNTKLTQLDCSYNSLLNNLDLSGCTALKKLSCNHNDQLKKLDMSNCTALKELYCNKNVKLKKLDLSKNTELTHLDFSDDKFNSLNLIENANLTYLKCNNSTVIPSLDISQNTKLDTLICDNGFSKTNLSQNTNLVYLECPNNQLTELGIESNNKLTHLNCNNNSLTSAGFNLSQNTKLAWLNCEHNQLTELHLENNAELTYLNCDHNSLSAGFDISHNTSLDWLQCEYNELTQLHLESNTELTHLYCKDGNKLTSLDLTHNCKLNKDDTSTTRVGLDSSECIDESPVLRRKCDERVQQRIKWCTTPTVKTPKYFQGN